MIVGGLMLSTIASNIIVLFDEAHMHEKVMKQKMLQVEQWAKDLKLTKPAHCQVGRLIPVAGAASVDQSRRGGKRRAPAVASNERLVHSAPVLASACAGPSGVPLLAEGAMQKVKPTFWLW